MAYTKQDIEDLERATGKIYARNFEEGVRKIKKNLWILRVKHKEEIMPYDMTEEELNKITFTIPEETYSFDENGDIIMI